MSGTEYLTKEELEIIKEIYDSNNQIVSVYLCGSAVYPWIKNINDIDVVFITKRGILKIDSSRLRKKISCITRTEEVFINTAVFKPLLAYTIPLRKRLFGKSYDNELALLNNPQTIQLLINFLSSNYIHKKPLTKNIYHLITSLFILENNSYNLTDKQITDINKIHDNPECQESRYWIEYYYNKYKGENYGRA